MDFVFLKVVLIKQNRLILVKKTRKMFRFIVYTPLAQLVEHLTLNQGVRGSTPRWCTIVLGLYILVVI